MKTNLRTGESAPSHAARMFIVPITLFSWAARGGLPIESTTRRVSTTVSISAAATIRRMQRVLGADADELGALELDARVARQSTPMIASTAGSRSSAWARRPPQ